MSRPIVIAAGGTGGHLFPAQALAAELVRRGRAVVLATDTRGRNYGELFPGAEVATTASASPSAPGLWAKAAALGRIGQGVLQALSLLRRRRPDAVVGFGGYPAFPSMAAAALLGVPTVLHEQNAVLGRVNRAVAGRMNAIAAAFPIAAGLPAPARGRVTVTGNPVRPEVAALAGTPYAAPQPGEPVRLLVFGGSQGARVFTDVIPEAVANLPEALRARLDIVQQARPEDLERARAAYAKAGAGRVTLAPFFADMPQRIAAAHLVIARAGASTSAELCAIGRPAILVPYPYATDDHQRYNAEALAQAGAVLPVLQTEFTAGRLAGLLTGLFDDPARLPALAAAAARLGRPEATARLADLVERVASGAAALPVRPVSESAS